MTVDDQHLERILNRVHEWTRSADSKVSVLAGAEAGLLAYLLPKIEKWWTAGAGQMAGTWTGLVMSTALMLIGIGWALAALFPRDTNPNRRKSVTFFGDAAQMKLDAYRVKLDQMEPLDVRSDYVSQIHASAGIARTKHKFIRLSSVCFVIGIGVLGALRLFAGLRWW